MIVLKLMGNKPEAKPEILPGDKKIGPNMPWGLGYSCLFFDSRIYY